MPRSDPVLVITGASSGIGAATARQAVAAGWRVALGARSEDRLEQLAEELGSDRAFAHTCDVTSFENQEALVQAAVDRFGGIDAHFANAGFGAQRGFLEGDPEQWRAMVETNVTGVAYSVRAALARFRAQASGHILITSSNAGRRNLPGSLYSATKHAVTAIGDNLRAEVAGEGIRVTLIEPGMVDTPFFDDRPTGALEADDVARAVVFALSQPEHVEVAELLIVPVRRDG